MSEAIPPLPQYALMAWCSVKAQGQLYLFYLLHVLNIFVLNLSSYSLDALKFMATVRLSKHFLPSFLLNVTFFHY
jgi:hypothetical protein